MRMLLLIPALLLAILSVDASPVVHAQTFSNPIIAHGADPSVIFADGSYYSVQAGCPELQSPGICIRAAPGLAGLGAATPVAVWSPNPGAANAKDIWAPQIRHFDTRYPGGQWYVYFAADAKGDNDHRLFALVPAEPTHPLGRWVAAATGANEGALLTDGRSDWAIDPDVFEASDHRLYLLFSCRQDNTNRNPGRYQSICLAGMSDPLHLQADATTGKKVVELSYPDQRWETRGFPTEEGPFGYTRNGVDYIFYSGSYSGAPDMYAQGVLIDRHRQAGHSSLTDPAAWVKEGPIFDGHHFSYGTASSVLVPSPDGTEIWNVYHGTDCRVHCTKDVNGRTWRDRSVRAQRAAWSVDGSPVLGYPVDIVDVEDSSGERVPLAPPSRDHHGTDLQAPWGDAFGDAAEGDTHDGLQTGGWASSGLGEIRISAVPADGVAQAFFGANPNLEDYVVSTQVQFVGADQGKAGAEYGIYGAYVDHGNWFAASVDVGSCPAPGCLRTEAMAGGLPQPSASCALPPDFDPKSMNTLSVVAANGTYTVRVNGVAPAGACQNRSLNLTVFGNIEAAKAHGVNGHVGVRVSYAKANFTGFRVAPSRPGDGEPQ